MLVAAALLVLARLPSLVQPMGADQGLYAYVGERILRGELPYVDAWDQKPPAVHYAYALMRAIWPADAVVAAADLAAAVAIAACLFVAGRALAIPGVGAGSALLFLLLSNPSFTRLNGVRVRAQCETFIALAVAAAVCVLARRERPAWAYAAGGLLMGAAVAFKYNAAVYVLAAAVVVVIAGRATAPRALAFVAGLAVAPAVLLALLAKAVTPLYDATIAYNLQYSGETYSGPLHFVSYLLTFPVWRAREDALWTLGGAGCTVLIAAGVRNPRHLVPVVWVAAACLSIAINGSRGLPQYFVQAAPALALAAAWGGWVLVRAARSALAPAGPVACRSALAASLLIVATAVWRVNQFPKLAEQTAFDLQHALGRIPRDLYLARYADERKYSALAAAEIGRFMRDHSAPGSRVYLFGFSSAAYVYAGRASASRFFWSRPIIAGFKQGDPGYGTQGLLRDLEGARPQVVALQINDWAPDVDDSAHYFLTTAPLAEWLRSHYTPVTGPRGFDVWIRRD